MDHYEVAAGAPDHYDCARVFFGDRWRFGIECEVQDSGVDPWGSLEPFGSFWFWLGGQVVGNPDVAEQLVHVFGPFHTAEGAVKDRKASEVPGVSRLDKFDFIVWRRFGEDEDFEPRRWGNCDIAELRQLDLIRFEIIPGGYSPFQDGWQGVLLQESKQDTFVWRKDVGSTYELSLPPDEFSRVLALAGDWFRNLRKSRVVAVENKGGRCKPLLIRRSEDHRFVGI